MADVEIGDLEELIGGKGWAWLTDQAQREWGALALVSKIEGIAKSAPDATTQQAQTNQVLVAKREVENFLNLPVREIQKRREAIRTRPDEFAGARRRGETL